MNRIDIRDLPIHHENEDYLELDKYAKALAAFIQTSETPLTISLQGEWGSGKTSLMNILRKKLCDQDMSQSYECIWINTWELYLQGDEKDAIEHLAYLILKEISQISQEKNSKLENELEDIFDNFKRYFIKTADLIMSISGADAEARKQTMGLFNQNDHAYIKQLRTKLSKVVNMLIDTKNNLSDKGFIFFIDDLDRIQPSLAIKVLEVLKNLFSIEKCVFILAIDYEVIVKGLKEKYGEEDKSNHKIYRSYFDKLIQLPFVMPISKYDISSFVLQSLVDIAYFDNLEELTRREKDSIVRIITTTIGKNPRSIKRLMNAVKLSKIYDDGNETILKNKGFKITNLLFLCMQLAYPKIYNIFEQHPICTSWRIQQFPHLMVGESINEQMPSESEWKQIVYKIAMKDVDLERRISSIMILMDYIEELFEYNEDISKDNITKIISLSALTNLSYMSTSEEMQYDGKAYDQSSETQYKQGSHLVDMVDLKDNNHILDVGCGNGKTTMDLYKKNKSITIDAFDLSKSQIETAVKNRRENGISEHAIKFYVKDATAIDYNNKYDLVFSNSALHWITDANKMYRLLFNALKDNGQLAVHQGGYKSYYGLHHAVRQAIKNLKYHCYYENWEYPVFYPTQQEMKELLVTVGFRDIQVRSVSTDGKEYKNLIENFCNASLLPYLNRLPQEELKQALIDEYYNVCINEDIDTYTHRLYIFAKKGETNNGD